MAASNFCTTNFAGGEAAYLLVIIKRRVCHLVCTHFEKIQQLARPQTLLILAFIFNFRLQIAITHLHYYYLTARSINIKVLQLRAF